MRKFIRFILASLLLGVAILGASTLTAEANSNPSFVYPKNGQTLDYEGDYLFEVKPITGADLYHWSFLQNGIPLVDSANDPTQAANEYGIHVGTPAHAKFVTGAVKVLVSAHLPTTGWTGTTTITIYLKLHQPTPTFVPPSRTPTSSATFTNTPTCGTITGYPTLSLNLNATQPSTPINLNPTPGTQQIAGDLAYNKPTFASSYWQTGYPAGATDGVGGLWQSASSTGTWLYADLGQCKAIHEIVSSLYVDNNFTSAPDHNYIVSNDLNTWYIVVDEINTSNATRNTRYLILPQDVSARYVGIYGANWSGGWADMGLLAVLPPGDAVTATPTNTPTLPPTATLTDTPFPPSTATDTQLPTNTPIDSATNTSTPNYTTSPLPTITPSVTPTAPATISTTLSTASANPISVPADGISLSTLTVNVKNTLGQNVPGVDVRLNSTPSVGIVVSPSLAITDGLGNVQFTVSSTVAQTVTFAVEIINVDPNAIILAQQPQVTFYVPSTASPTASSTTFQPTATNTPSQTVTPTSTSSTTPAKTMTPTFVPPSTTPSKTSIPTTCPPDQPNC